MEVIKPGKKIYYPTIYCNCCGLQDGPYIPIRWYQHSISEPMELLCAFCLLLNTAPDTIVKTVKLYYGMMQGPNKDRSKRYEPNPHPGIRRHVFEPDKSYRFDIFCRICHKLYSEGWH